MKKSVLAFILFVSVAFGATAQNKVEINGTYKYGSKNERIHIKSIRTSSGDQVVSLEFAPLTRLEKEVKELRNTEAKLRKDLERCRASSGGKTTPDNSAEVKALQDSLAAVQKNIADKDKQLNDLNRELEQLKREVAACRREKADTVRALLAEIDRLVVESVEPVSNRDAISITGGINMSRLINDGIGNEPWAVRLPMGKEAEISWLHYFSPSSPVALRIGIAYRELNGRADCDLIKDTLSGLNDIDLDKYDAHYMFNDVSERMSLRQLTVPIMLHVGNSYKNFGLKGWIEAGVAISYNLATSFERKGTYNCEGYYPEWNVTITDVEQLGFVTDKDLTVPQVDNLSSVVLWGQLAAGVYVPVGNNLGMDFGVSCGYSLMPVTNGNGIGKRRYDENAMMIVDGGKTRILSTALKLGIVYHL